jgi:phytoene synthase
MKRTPSVDTTQGAEASALSVDRSTNQASVLLSHQVEQLFATHGKTFHFASRFFPQKIRPAIVTLYAFFRTLDDLVDERASGWQAEAVVRELDAWQEWFLLGCASAAPREPLGARLAAVLAQFDVPLALFQDFLCGQRSDLEPRVFADAQELLLYCYQAAGTVGLALAHVLGTRSEQALRAARHLGIAMQLTNILRDVGRDLAYGRIYLPQDELARFSSSSAHLSQLYQEKQGPDERFRELMRYQIRRARLFYMQGLHGCWLLPRNCRVPILLAGRLYQRILQQIERCDYDVLRRRAATGLFTKLREAGAVILLAALWQWGEHEHSIESECLDEP